MRKTAILPGHLALPAVAVALGLFAAAAPARAQTAHKDNHSQINIVAAELDYYDKDQKLVYTGNVVAVRGETTLKTPKLTVFLAPRSHGSGAQKVSSSDRIRRMEAVGPVTMISKDQVARGDSGIYLKADDKVYLNGNVSLTQGPNVTLGDHIVYDLHTTEAVVTGHVRSLFLPDSDNGNTSSDGAEKPKTKHKSGAKRSESAER
ncbi:MAG: LptA/OstA family protein [Methylovirgula sp.]